MVYDPVKHKAYYQANREKILARRRGKPSPQNTRIKMRNEDIKRMSVDQLLEEVGYYN